MIILIYCYKNNQLLELNNVEDNEKVVNERESVLLMPRHIGLNSAAQGI